MLALVVYTESGAPDRCWIIKLNQLVRFPKRRSITYEIAGIFCQFPKSCLRASRNCSTKCVRFSAAKIGAVWGISWRAFQWLEQVLLRRKRGPVRQPAGDVAVVPPSPVAGPDAAMGSCLNKDQQRYEVIGVLGDHPTPLELANHFQRRREYDVIRALLLNPVGNWAPMSYRQVARHIGCSVSTAHSLMRRMEGAGILSTQSFPQGTHVALNPNHPLVCRVHRIEC
jgi:hypothetical protein